MMMLSLSGVQQLVSARPYLFVSLSPLFLSFSLSLSLYSTGSLWEFCCCCCRGTEARRKSRTTHYYASLWSSTCAREHISPEHVTHSKQLTFGWLKPPCHRRVVGVFLSEVELGFSKVSNQFYRFLIRLLPFALKWWKLIWDFLEKLYFQLVKTLVRKQLFKADSMFALSRSKKVSSCRSFVIGQSLKCLSAPFNWGCHRSYKTWYLLCKKVSHNASLNTFHFSKEMLVFSF